MSDIYATCRAAAVEHPSEDPVAVARRLVASVAKVDLVPLVADRVANEQRLVARQVEAEAFAVPFRAAVAGPAGQLLKRAPAYDVTDEFRALFRQQFALGDGTAVAWGQATVEQHEQRLAWLYRHRDGVNQTIARHEAAVRLLRESGASCLEDLERQKVAA